ncbi:putative gyf domain-containing protein [Golovinomyces cichoracearum]|uniref:Putative gyf domain-containing protein n=1 Tax=Golovinomyces cichoracearum TaxID=62708 RepID=A0A420IHN1_9PEZI|nr:putative gyf domain-containing protein [Golovinomyces cichoracearum]
MPSQMPSTFAAAAGHGSACDIRSGGKSEARGNADWARKDSKLAINGTLTLRRPLTNPSSQISAQGETQVQNEQESLNLEQSVYESSNDFRYSKQELLEIYKRQIEPGAAERGSVSHLFADSWAPGESIGSSVGASWGNNGDVKNLHAPDICWDFLGDTRPVGLEEMSEEEKKLFMADINSPFKPASQNLKDSSFNGRKSSFSHGQGPGSFNHQASPVYSRTNARRQQTNDQTISAVFSPNSATRFSRDEQSPFYNRKFDKKDGSDERCDDSKSCLPLSGLIRGSNFGSTLSVGQLSPWASPSNTATSPMGAFGNFALSDTSSSVPNDKIIVNPRVESRFFQTTPKETLEDTSKPPEISWRPRQRTDTDPFSDELPNETSINGGDDNGNLIQRFSSFDPLDRENTNEKETSEMPSFHDALKHEQNHHTPSVINIQAEPLSPSDTNPYRSPLGPQKDRKQFDTDLYDPDAHIPDRAQGLGGIRENDQSTYGILSRGFPNTTFDGSDRSQTSSAAGSRGISQLGGLPSLGTIGVMSGWPATSGTNMGISDRENSSGFPSAFGNSIFNTVGDVHSPGHSSITGKFGPVNNPSVPTTRGSKLGSLFPASLQAQMQTIESEVSGESESRQNAAFGVIARNSFTPSRDLDSPIRSGRHGCEDPFPSSENSRSIVTIPTPEMIQVPTVSAFKNSSQQNNKHTLASDSVTNQHLPTTQQRMMVMPDRMRWLYLDPQGQVQGPFSGLEMHDWYKASFFTPDLSVKKIEDGDFEPLGQLIRRIGNSREPFLVPQIGIPHGQPSAQTGAVFTSPVAGHCPGSAQPGAVQPPFANSFPSFGTTLTAEQQNNLERRKQEEQYLMARQREFLAQQQVNMKQMQMNGLQSVLHHSNLHNLQGPTGFGGIPSPIGIQQQPHLTSGPGFFDSMSRHAPTVVMPGEFYREDDLSRLTPRDRQGQQVSAIFGQPDVQNQVPTVEDIDFDARIQEFEKLREQTELEESAQSHSTAQKPKETTETPQKLKLKSEEQALPEQKVDSDTKSPETLPIRSKVLQNSSKKHLQAETSQEDSPWAKFNPSLPLPFPPPQVNSSEEQVPSVDNSKLPEILNSKSYPLTRKPETIAVKSIAPWAKDPIELPKPISLKETSEAEAKKAAKAEETAAAARRANIEQEARSNSSQITTALPPGLPTTATWASNPSPQSAPAKSVWANPITKTQTTTNKQKTLADIQREEELRKKKLAAASTANQPSVSAHGAKRYADLASKANSNKTPTGGPAWFTVGAGGKIKVPTGPSSPQVSGARSASAHTMTLPTRVNSKTTTPAARSATASATNNVTTARDELTRWAKATLEKSLNPGINVNEFVAMLSSFPSEPSIIADSIYSQSQTLNGNDFAIEFIRRRNNAEKGILEPGIPGSGPAFSATNDKTGGWSEVAKKGPPKEEPAASFKLVPNKKKDRK